VPKVVDRERRRGELAAAAARVVSRIGLEGVSVQAVAAEAGCSVGSIAHYFRNKDELLLHALRVVTEALLAPLRELAGGAGTVDGLQALARASLPLDAARERDWRVRLAFWTRGSGPPEEVQLARHQLAEWRALWEGALRAAQAQGSVRADVDARETSAGVVALIVGSATQLLLRPRSTAGAALAAVVDGHLRALAARAR